MSAAFVCYLWDWKVAQGRMSLNSKSIAAPEDARYIDAFRFVALER